MKNHVLYFNQPYEISIQEEEIPQPLSDEVLIKNIISGISTGTEMLFYKGLMPDDISMDETIAALKKTDKYPFKYGYCSVGEVVETGHANLHHLLHQRVFVFHPHESYFCAKETDLILLPDNLSPRDALFIPNMETAVNLIMDGAPMIGENVLVLGLGIVGLLTTALLGQFPLDQLLGMDLYKKRRDLALDAGLTHSFDANHPDVDSLIKNYLEQAKNKPIDLIYELTGNPAAVNRAISHLAYEGRVVLGSWYGKKACPVDLGGRFHRNRMRLIASQVSTIASHLQGRWDKGRRFDLVFKMLEKIKPARFISHHFPIVEAQKAYELLDAHPEDTLMIYLNYEEI